MKTVVGKDRFRLEEVMGKVASKPAAEVMLQVKNGPFSSGGASEDEWGLG